MHNVIIGTAGHVDHGKTCLIKALTGTDTDRLAEEKKRGITIELGFANLPNDEGLRIGIIDVPGHEKFVKNMLAGIGGIDLVLLIVALDEGVMPQTTEHFNILKMLNIKKGIIVLTKADMVDEELAELVEEDVRDLVQGSFLENAPSIRVSSYTGENIPELKRLILDTLKDTAARKNDKELFRLPIDRVFVMKGFGTVVTGTLIEGSCELGDDVMIYPKAETVRIRGIQNHNEKEESALSGQRTALNLTGVEKADLERGEVLAAPGSMIPSILLDAKVKLFDDTKRKLKNQDRVYISYGSAQTIAKAVLLDRDVLLPGEEAYVQFRFEEPVAVKFGDLFIIRFYSPTESFGGGRFLGCAPAKHKRNDETVLKSLAAKEKGEKIVVLEEEIREKRADFPEKKELAVRIGETLASTEKLLKKLVEEQKVMKAGVDGYIHRDYWQQILAFSDEILTAFHRENPILQGMEKAEFANRLGHRFHIPQAARDGLLTEMKKRNAIRLTDSAVASPGFSSGYEGGLEKTREKVLQIYDEAGVESPSNDEVLSSFDDKKQIRQMLPDLAKQGELVKLDASHYLARKHFDRAKGAIEEAIKKNGTITLAEFRDLMGTSRKYALLLLDAFDQKKITKVVGEGRVLI